MSLTEKDQKQRAYIEERIRLGLAEQGRVREQWQAEEQELFMARSTWRRKAKAILLSVGFVGLFAGCVAGWVLTLWQTPSIEVAVNYVCVLGFGVLLINLLGKIGRWSALISLFLVIGIMGVQMWFDQYHTQEDALDGRVIIERWGRWNPTLNYRWEKMPETYSGLAVVHGPMTRSGKRHGVWIYEYSPGSHIPKKEKWYWEDQEMSEDTWRLRSEQRLSPS